MKPIYLFFSCIILGGTLAFKPKDVFNDLNITHQEVKTQILNGIKQETYRFPVNKLAKTLSPEARAAAVTALAVFAREYVNSKDFLYDYMGTGEATYEDISGAEENLAAQFASAEASSFQMQIDFSRQGIEYMKKALDNPYLGAAEKAEMKKQIAEAEKELNVFEQEHKEQQLEIEKEAKENNRKSYAQAQQDLEDQKAQQELLKGLQKEEEEKTAKEIRKQLKIRLEKFLADTEGMDFNAKLIPGRNGVYKFTDPQLEAKDKQWKLYFRAGEAPVMAARSFAKDWLKELE